MVKMVDLIDRIDTIRANSVSNHEFEKTWGRTLDSQVKKMMTRWDELQARARAVVEADNDKA